jgi:hypothetical protein
VIVSSAARERLRPGAKSQCVPPAVASHFSQRNHQLDKVLGKVKVRATGIVSESGHRGLAPARKCVAKWQSGRDGRSARRNR